MAVRIIIEQRELHIENNKRTRIENNKSTGIERSIWKGGKKDQIR